MVEYKDITTLKKEIADFKRSVGSPNNDYLTGYICALSVTEGMIANLPTVDLVEVVRCKDCEHFSKEASKVYNGHFCEVWLDYLNPDDFCSYGKRKED